MVFSPFSEKTLDGGASPAFTGKNYLDSAEPLTVRLPPFDDVSHLAGGVRNGHFVDEKLELNFQPVVVIGDFRDATVQNRSG